MEPHTHPAQDRGVPAGQIPRRVRPHRLSIPPATLDYLTSLEWITAPENLCLVGPAGTGKSHLLVALGVAAVQAGHRVRYFTAADLVETLYRGLADDSVGRVIDTLLRNDLIICDEVGFAPLDDTLALSATASPVGPCLLVGHAGRRRGTRGSRGRGRSGRGSFAR